MDDGARRRRAAAAFADLASNAARERPRLLVFEDIHWATPLLLSCLAAVAMVTRACPLVLARDHSFRGRPAGPPMARRQPRGASAHHRPGTVAPGGGAHARRGPDRGLQPLRRAMHRAGGRQPAVPGAAAAQRRGRRQRQHPAHHSELGVGSDGPPHRSRQARLAGGRSDRQALPSGGAAIPDRRRFLRLRRSRGRRSGATRLRRLPLRACAHPRGRIHLALAQPQTGPAREGRGMVRADRSWCCMPSIWIAPSTRAPHAHTWSPHKRRRVTFATTSRCGWRSEARCWRRTASRAMRSPCCAAIFCARWRVRTSPSLRSTRRCTRPTTMRNAAVPGWGLQQAAA